MNAYLIAVLIDKRDGNVAYKARIAFANSTEEATGSMYVEQAKLHPGCGVYLEAEQLTQEAVTQMYSIVMGDNDRSY